MTDSNSTNESDGINSALINSAQLVAGLNPEQKAGTLHFEGPILILAGAGSGKTRVLTHRIANLVTTHKVLPAQILAVTFTNKAANEMKTRLRSLLGQKADQVWAGTFHSICLRLLRRHAKLLGYSNDFVVYDDQDSKGVVKAILKELGINEKKHPIQSFLRVIDFAKNNYTLPEAFEREAKSIDGRLQAQVYTAYQQALLRANAMDFGDLLVNAVLLLDKFPDIQNNYQRSVGFVLVDEFQDTNKVQYMFLSLLARLHKNLFVVGDDDQSIYSFRGASVENLLNFESDFPGAKVIRLEQNYRSTESILELAHAVIEKNKRRKEKKLWTEGPKGEPSNAFVANDEIEEANYVAARIVELKAAGNSLKDIAIFYRTNAQSRALEEALISSKIPYRIFGGLKFYERKEIKDILAYARLILNEQDNQAFDRIVNTPPRGIGPQTLRNVHELAATNKSSLFEASTIQAEDNNNIRAFVKLIKELQSASRSLTLSGLLEQIIEKSEYGPTLKVAKDPYSQSRIENLAELVAIGRSIELENEDASDTLRGFLDRVALTAGSDDPDNKDGNAEASASDAVSLMTLHLAKGLEFKNVFLTGLEEGLLPHYRSMMDSVAVEEERRLLYVGITRARQKLYLTRATVRGMFSGSGFGGGGAYRPASRFINDMPSDLIVSEMNSFSGDSYYIDQTSSLANEGTGSFRRRNSDDSDSDVSFEEDAEQSQYVDGDGATLRSFFKRKSGQKSAKRVVKWKLADDL